MESITKTPNPEGKIDLYTIGSRHHLSRLGGWDFDPEIPPMNALIMYEPPDPKFTYTVGVDPGWGLGADRSVIHVLRNGTMHSPDTQVAEFISDELNVHALTPICYTIGCLYGNASEELEALMSVECNISDDIVHNLRFKYNYTNLFVWKYYDNVKRMFSNKLGWWTNARTRPKLINKAIQYIQKEWWNIRSPWMIYEMRKIKKQDADAQARASSGFHDDIFMAGVIAMWSAHDLEFSEEFGNEEVAVKRDRVKGEVEASQTTPPPIGERRDFQNTATTYQQMQNYGDSLFSDG